VFRHILAVKANKKKNTLTRRFFIPITRQKNKTNGLTAKMTFS